MTPVEYTNPMGLMETGNAAFSKLSTLLAYLLLEIERACSQVFNFGPLCHILPTTPCCVLMPGHSIMCGRAQIQRGLFAPLLMFGEHVASAPEEQGNNEGVMQIAVAAFLPSLRRLQVRHTRCRNHLLPPPPSWPFAWGCSQGLLDRLEAAAGNLLGQLGALSAEQTRKATILQGFSKNPVHTFGTISLPVISPSSCNSAKTVSALYSAGAHAVAAFMGLASALGTLVRLDAIAARNRHLLPAIAAYRR